MSRKDLRKSIIQALQDNAIEIRNFKLTAPKSGAVDCRLYFVAEDIPAITAQKNRSTHFVITLCSTDQDLIDDVSEQVQAVITSISSSYVLEGIEQDYMQQDQAFLLEAIRFRISRIATN